MEFKIDTKPSYTVITPVSNVLNANLTGAVRQKWIELTESGSHNVIIDLQNCISTDENVMEGLTELHEEIYASRQSLVFTNIRNEVLTVLKEKGIDLLINVAPTLEEAIDIVSMEILERDLFNEES